MGTPELNIQIDGLIGLAFQRVGMDAIAAAIQSMRTAQPILAGDSVALKLDAAGLVRGVRGGYKLDTSVENVLQEAMGETIGDYTAAANEAELKYGREVMVNLAQRLRDNPALELTSTEAAQFTNLGKIPDRDVSSQYHLVYMSSAPTENQSERYRFSVLARNVLVAKYRS